ncbi:hypothetical protein OU997_03250 [Pseudomonas sp. SL4(2022)]|uniref:hypothetical protein n=1 Tax=Pseudomonas sp. SL4(2022) TaxID=2994661 RepID=UPI00227204F6|nr:hypothetical protein [Pseudomonas sp. SL4(2022)]WAC45225.1 hypothetical protein OU997_03250 [Pseudomonas sp. SL4(2022)]
MTGITPTVFNMKSVTDHIRKTKEDGTLQISKHTKIAVPPEMKAEHAERVRESAKTVAESKAAFNRAELESRKNVTKPPSPTHSVENSDIHLPNIASLSRESAVTVLKSLEFMTSRGMDSGKSIFGMNGDKKTDSIETYESWLRATIGIDEYV